MNHSGHRWLTFIVAAQTLCLYQSGRVAYECDDVDDSSLGCLNMALGTENNDEAKK